MHLLYMISIALANNIDNISVRIVYSIRNIKISLAKNLWISIITFFISSASAFSGSILPKYLNKQISSVLSLLLLVGMGLWIILEPYIKKAYNKKVIFNKMQHTNFVNILNEPEKADANNSKDIDFKEATILGIALSLNNIGGSLSIGIMGLNPIFIGLFSSLISFLVLLLGNYAAEFFNRWNFQDKANIIAGIILILIGIKQVIH